MTSPNLVAIPGSGVHLVPVAGPPGPRGPVGPSGAELGLAGGFVHTQSSAVPPGQPMQIIHDLTYKPAGVICKETDGTIIEPAQIDWPAANIVEITHGVSFTGTVFLS